MARDRDKHKAWCEANKESRNARSIQWQKDNKELIKLRNQSPERKKQLRAAVKKWRDNNKEKDKAARKLYYDNNKDKIQNSRLLREYGITLVEFSRMKESIKQCEICNASFSNTTCHIDHCHASGRVRGLLCFNCNAALGMLKESIQILQNALSYLGKHKETI